MFLASGITRTKLGPDFQRIWASVTVSSLGDGMRFVALPLLAAQLTSDPRQVAFVYVAEQLPLLLFGLLSGAIADRLDRCRILWVVDAVRALIVGALAVAVAVHAMTVPLLAGIGFLLGLGQTLYNGAWSGIVPTLVASSELTRANARLQAGSLITDTLLGTPLGALLFGVAATLPFAVDAASFAAAAILALTLSGDFRPQSQAAPKPWRTLLGDTSQGVRWLWHQPLLRRLCLTSGITNFVGGGLIAILVLYARQILGLTSLGFALLVASFAIGGVAGAMATPRLSGRFGTPRVLRLTAAATAGTAVAAGAASSGLAAGACIAAYGAANLAWNVTAVSLRQTLVPAHLLGRVGMAYQMVIGGGTTLGAALAGFEADAFGLRAPFYIGGALLLAASLVSMRPAGNDRSTPDGATASRVHAVRRRTGDRQSERDR
ncbi:MFS transporter [Streptomyces sp. NPDC059582]|uniref:MFS transporter n=1 Tax=Streptomyces sp. NPDC059582 TaxID=3346875 RepID=UPI0036AA5511